MQRHFCRQSHLKEKKIEGERENRRGMRRGGETRKEEERRDETRKGGEGKSRSAGL